MEDKNLPILRLKCPYCGKELEIELEMDFTDVLKQVNEPIVDENKRNIAVMENTINEKPK